MISKITKNYLKMYFSEKISTKKEVYNNIKSSIGLRYGGFYVKRLR